LQTHCVRKPGSRMRHFGLCTVLISCVSSCFFPDDGGNDGPIKGDTGLYAETEDAGGYVRPRSRPQTHALPFHTSLHHNSTMECFLVSAIANVSNNNVNHRWRCPCPMLTATEATYDSLVCNNHVRFAKQYNAATHAPLFWFTPLCRWTFRLVTRVSKAT
jgi:hypothetical protein